MQSLLGRTSRRRAVHWPKVLRSALRAGQPVRDQAHVRGLAGGHAAPARVGVDDTWPDPRSRATQPDAAARLLPGAPRGLPAADARVRR
eukprot:4981055-Prymnesium_polylepis.1